MLTPYINFINNIAKKVRYKSIEFICAFQALMWGLWLSYPANSFASTSSYKFMASILSENVWAHIMVFLGALTLWGMMFGNMWVKRIIFVCGLFIWITVGVCFWLGNPISTAVANSITFILIQLIALRYNMRKETSL